MGADYLGNVHRPWQTMKGNIARVVLIDLSDGDFEPGQPFFLRSTGGGSVTYCPWGNENSEAITKTFAASVVFQDPEMCRKVFATGSPLMDDLYAGYGI